MDTSIGPSRGVATEDLRQRAVGLSSRAISGVTTTGHPSPSPPLSSRPWIHRLEPRAGRGRGLSGEHREWRGKSPVWRRESTETRTTWDDGGYRSAAMIPSLLPRPRRGGGEGKRSAALASLMNGEAVRGVSRGDSGRLVRPTSRILDRHSGAWPQRLRNDRQLRMQPLSTMRWVRAPTGCRQCAASGLHPPRHAMTRSHAFRTGTARPRSTPTRCGSPGRAPATGRCQLGTRAPRSSPRDR